MDARAYLRYAMAVPDPRAHAHISGVTSDAPAVGWAVPVDGHVALYGREGLAHGLLVVAATPLLVYFGHRDDGAVWPPTRWLPVDRSVLWGNAAGRQPLYAKLARALGHHS